MTAQEAKHCAIMKMVIVKTSMIEDVCSMLLNSTYRIHSTLLITAMLSMYACGQRPQGIQKSEDNRASKAGMWVR